jgi:hypothetical protein
MSSPRSTIEALCIECRYEDCGTGARYDPQGEWHPSVGYPSPGSGWNLAPGPELPDPYPSPVMHSRRPLPLTFIAPSPVRLLAEFAREHSWEVRTQYSQGNVPHGVTGHPGPLRDLIGLRFGEHPITPRQAYAIYSRTASGGTWTWSSVMIWGPDLPPFGGCGVTELKAYLMMPDASTEALKTWVEDIRTIRSNGVDLTKRRQAARKELFRMLDAGESLAQIREHVSALYTPEEVQKIIAGRKTVLREGFR